MTQKDLASAMGFGQAKISKMEDELVAITKDDVSLLAGALKYPESFFYRRDIAREPFNGLYRKRKTLPTKILTQFNAIVSIRAARIDRLARKDIGAINCDIPYCDPDEFEGGATEVAGQIRQFLHLSPGPIRNLTTIFEDHGIIVVKFDLGTLKLDGVSIFSKAGRPIIFVNERSSKSRQVFTLVHELAHIVMHRLPKPAEIADRESDEFTAEFLMPESDIVAAFRSVGFISLEALQSLKLHWNVSIAALLRRARDLGFIDQGRYTSLNVMMSQRGYRRTEPFEQHIRVGEPSFEKELIEFHRGDLGYSESDLAQFLDMTGIEFDETYQTTSRFKIVT